MKNLVGNIVKGAEIVDDFHESGEERQKALSDRHSVDMASDNFLSKTIRPITLIWLLALETLVVLLDSFGYSVDVTTKGQVGVLLLSAFGFYFQSKKNERVAEKNAKANIELERIKTKAEIKERKKLLRKGLLFRRGKKPSSQDLDDYERDPFSELVKMEKENSEEL